MEPVHSFNVGNMLATLTFQHVNGDSRFRLKYKGEER